MSDRPAYDVAFYVPTVGPLLAPVALTPPGGAETQVLLLTRALAAQGARVCVVVYDLEGVELPQSYDGVDVIVRPPYRGGSGLVGMVREVAAIGRALWPLRARVLATRIAGPHVGVVGVVARLRRRRFVYSSASSADFDLGVRRRSRRDRVFYRVGLRLADVVVVQTEEQRRLCERQFRRPAILIRSLAEVRGVVGRAPEYFLWIGRANDYKRPMDFVELARAVPEARFRMVAVPEPGRQTLADDLEAAASGVPNLELLRPRPRAEILDLIAGAVATVNTSEFEGMSNVALEGWALGVPALMYRVDPDRLVEELRLGKFARGSWDDFVAGAARLWADRGDSELREACRAYIAENHGLDAAVSRWLQVIGVRKQQASSFSSLSAEVS